MLTANRLRDGDVLYRKGDGWVLYLTEGDVYRDQGCADAALAAANAELVRNEFVAPYLFEVREVGFNFIDACGTCVSHRWNLAPPRWNVEPSRAFSANQLGP